MLAMVFTRDEARRAGFSVKTINALVRSGVWTALRRGVYAETSRLPAEGAQRHAAEVAAASRATGLDVVGTHESAAVVHALTTFAPYVGPPVLTRHREAGGGRPDGTAPALLAAHVPAHHRLEVHGAPVTTLARTAVDLARKGPALSAVVALDAALRREVSREQVEEVLKVAKGWPGSRRAAEYVAFADARAESALESVGRWRMYQFGLPKPELQFVVRDGAGTFLGRADYAFEQDGVLGEADGLQKYRSSPDDAWNDSGGDNPLSLEKLREDDFRDAGWEVFRFTWDIAVRRPAELERRARNAFRRAAERRRRVA